MVLLLENVFFGYCNEVAIHSRFVLQVLVRSHFCVRVALHVACPFKLHDALSNIRADLFPFIRLVFYYVCSNALLLAEFAKLYGLLLVCAGAILHGARPQPHFAELS